jgi:C4-dicarboxylate-specific signal transduction histidine kinase
VRQADGQYCCFFLRNVPLRDDAGKLIKWFGSGIEIQDRKRAEQERERVRQLQADLAHVNRVSMMGELTASLTHEIKQPMFAAAADAETCLRWLARDQPDVAEAQEAASRLVKDVTRASDIINRIVLLFKKDVPQRELVAVNGVIQEVIALLRSESNRYSISIHTELTEGLPNIMADRVALQQVLMNLMLNGIEATSAVTERPRSLWVQSRLDESGDVLVAVSDSGTGFGSEADRVFTPFFTTKANGMGMGLSISRSLVENHGGRLWATSNSPHGAIFSFTLPAAAGSPP